MLSLQHIMDYITCFGHNVKQGTCITANLMVGMHLQQPHQVTIHDFMTFEQLKRCRDELSLIQIEACLPTKGTYDVMDAHGTDGKVTLLNPLAMLASAPNKHVVLPKANPIQTLLATSRMNEAPHGGSWGSSIRGSKLGVLIKMEFLKPTGVNSMRRGIGGGLPWQEH